MEEIEEQSLSQDLNPIKQQLHHAINNGITRDQIENIIDTVLDQEKEKTDLRLKKEFRDGKVFPYKNGFFRVQRSDGKWNFFDQSKKPISKQWFEDADDFEQVNENVSAQVGIRYESDDYSGVEYKHLRKDGTYVEDTKTNITMKIIDTKKKPESLAKRKGKLPIKNKSKGNEDSTTNDINLIPDEITSEKIRNAEVLGIKLHSIPEIDIGSIENMQTTRIEEFLKILEKQFSNWHKTNLPKDFWHAVKDRAIDFPRLPKQWVFVEDIPSSKISELLGIKTRSGLTYTEILNLIQQGKDVILKKIGLPIESEIRLPTTIEWNILRNTNHWDIDNQYEWTSTNYEVKSSKVIIGNPENEETAKIGFASDSVSDETIGFRILIVLPDSLAA